MRCRRRRSIMPSSATWSAGSPPARWSRDALMAGGFRQGHFDDPQRTNWDGTGPRPVDWFAWYPAALDAVETPLPIAPWPHGWFKCGPAALDAPLATDAASHPLVVFSH